MINHPENQAANPLTSNTTALQGMRVLDLSRVLAGPFCTQILGDLGAQVIKIERPGVGDDTRQWGPPFIAANTSAYYTCANRNKRSLTVDIKSTAGQAIIHRLAATSDIVVENFKVGELNGLDYTALSAINPAIIYCSITGFGQQGPRANEPGYDFLIQALGGLMSITGDSDSPGYKVGVAVTDLFTGLWAVVAILAACQYRHRTGKGQYIDLALFDCQLSMLANVASNWLATNERPRRYGNAHPNLVPYQTFTACDGTVAIAVGNERQFAAFATAFAQPNWITQFPTNAIRVRQREACTAQLQQVLGQFTRREIIEKCQAVGVPAGQINTVDEAFADPQAQYRQMQITLTAKNGVADSAINNIGSPPDSQLRNQSDQVYKLVGSPLKLSASPVSYREAPPMLGADSLTILAELGYSPDEIAALQAEGVI